MIGFNKRILWIKSILQNNLKADTSNFQDNFQSVYPIKEHWMSLCFLRHVGHPIAQYNDPFQSVVTIPVS